MIENKDKEVYTMDEYCRGECDWCPYYYVCEYASARYAVFEEDKEESEEEKY